MISDLISLFFLSILISISTFGGGSQALFYQYGVLQNHWITRSDLSAVLAFGYATPGPAVFGTATFIGYRIAGLPGALIGTIGIFIIPFMTAFLAAKYLKNVLRNIHAQQFIKGVGLASTGLVAATAFSILNFGSAAVWQIAIAVIALFVSLRWKPNPLLILLAGLIFGIIWNN
jgi:chromate transporter